MTRFVIHKSPVIDNGDGTYSVNKISAFCYFVRNPRCGFSKEFYRHDTLPRWVINCWFFRASFGLDHDWVEVDAPL